MFEPTKFQGQLTDGQSALDVAFTATIDNTGALGLAFETQMRSRETAILHGEGEGRSVKYLRLEARAKDGAAFASDSFYITHWGSRSDETGSVIEFRGGCAQAQITRKLDKPVTFHQLTWFVRRLTGFGRPSRSTPLGDVYLLAESQKAENPQRLTGSIGLQGQGAAPDGWFDEADEALAHVARVMSFATGIVLRPYVERRVDGDAERVTITQRADTPEPLLEPFVFLNQEPIFAHACAMDADARARFKTLDGAVSWLLAPGYYDEIRLISAMTALENLVDELGSDDAAFLAKGRAWDRFASAVRALIKEHDMPEAMRNKVAELKRRSFIEKLDLLLEQLDVARHDIAPEAVTAMIGARNTVVHTGVYFDPGKADQADLWDHLLLARELVTRILLAALKFEGNYFAPLYSPQEQLRFPSCQPLTAPR